jgi:hypothetical protein
MTYDVGQVYWHNHVADGQRLPLNPAHTKRLNHWPVPHWPLVGQAGIDLPVPADTWVGFTLFVVFEPQQQTGEQVLWALSVAGQPPLVSTQLRLADLAKGQYLNWADSLAALPQLQTYYQAQGKQAAEPGRLHIGQHPPHPPLPVGDWQGSIAEWILYPRVLSPKQRLQIESYLALKYGITLAADKDYVSATGQVLWPAKTNKGYHHRVFGIGSDPQGRWQQCHGQSVAWRDGLSLHVENAPPHNGLPCDGLPLGGYWVIGDDAAPLQWILPPYPAAEQWLERTWLLQATGSVTETPTQLVFDLGRWLPTPADKARYLLAIDRSGTGHFTTNDTEFIPMQHLEAGRFGHFTGIVWDTDGSGQDAFTWVKTADVTADVAYTSGQLRVYPNPLTSSQSWHWQFVLPMPAAVTATLANAVGQVVWKKTWAADSYFAGREAALPTGVYQLTFRHSGHIVSQKLIVQ